MGTRVIFLRFAIHVEHYNRLFLGNARVGYFPSREVSRACIVLGDVCLHHVWDYVSTYWLMMRVRAWRMIIKVSQVGRFVSTLSQFLSSFLPRHEPGVCDRSRLRGDDLFAVVIKDTASRHTIRSINPLMLARRRYASFSFDILLS